MTQSEAIDDEKQPSPSDGELAAIVLANPVGNACRALFEAGREAGKQPDYETLTSMLTRAGIPFKRRSDGIWKTVQLEAGAADGKMDGYNGFFSVFYFNPNGALERVGIWE